MTFEIFDTNANLQTHFNPLKIKSFQLQSII
jgi:hypothetical protein